MAADRQGSERRRCGRHLLPGLGPIVHEVGVRIADARLQTPREPTFEHHFQRGIGSADRHAPPLDVLILRVAPEGLCDVAVEPGYGRLDAGGRARGELMFACSTAAPRFSTSGWFMFESTPSVCQWWFSRLPRFPM